MKSKVALLLILVGVVIGVSPLQGGAKEIFTKSFKPSDFSSYKVDATVLDLPLPIKEDQGPSDQSSYAYAIGIGGFPPGISNFELGWAEKDGNDFAFFTAAVNGSADAWAEIQLKDPKGIPADAGGNKVNDVGIRIKGKIRTADLTLAICGVSWNQAFGKILINGLEGKLSLFKKGNRPPDPSFDFAICDPRSLAKTAVKTLAEKTMDIIGYIQKGVASLKAAWDVAKVGLGSDEDFEAVFRFPSSLVDRQKAINQPLDIYIQFGFRSSAVAAAGAAAGGIIRIEEVQVIGFAAIDPIVRLEVWYRYHDGDFTAERLREVQTFDISRSLKDPVDFPYPSVDIACPPFPAEPTQAIRNRLYAFIGFWLWRLEYIEGPDPNNPSRLVRADQVGTTCSFSSIKMDRNQKVIFGFQRGVADLIVTNFRTEPAPPRQGEKFQLFVVVKNQGDLSALEADHGARGSLSGEFDLSVTVGGIPGKATSQGGSCPDPQKRGCPGFDLSIQPGEKRELQVFDSQGFNAWTAPQANGLQVRAIADIDNDIEEGISGETMQPNCLSNLCVRNLVIDPSSLPDPAFEDPKRDAGFTQIGPNLIRLHAIVTNLSPNPASNVEVRFEIGQEPSNRVIGQRIISQLGAQGSSTARVRVELDWDTSREVPRNYNILVKIDPDDKILERREDNNSAFFVVTLGSQRKTLKVQASCGGNELTGVNVRLTPGGDFQTPFSQGYTQGQPVRVEALDLSFSNCGPLRVLTYFKRWVVNNSPLPIGQRTTDLVLQQDTTAIAEYSTQKEGRTCASLKTDKPIYQLGETVNIIFSNNCAETILLFDFDFVILDSSNNAIFSPGPLPNVISVQPGTSRSWVWNQQDNAGQQAKAGIYTIELHTLNAGWYSTSFEIKSTTAATLLVRASDLTGPTPIPNVQISVFPPDQNRHTDGNTPLTLLYDVGDRVTLWLPNLSNCELNLGLITYAFQNWQDGPDAQIVGTRGTCREIVDIDIKGPNAIVTAFFELQRGDLTILTVRAADGTNPIVGVPIGVQPPDLSGQADGTTPFTRQYIPGTGTIVLQVQNLSGPSNCLLSLSGVIYTFGKWRADRDAQIVRSSGDCMGQATIELKITGFSPIVTALFERLGERRLTLSLEAICGQDTPQAGQQLPGIQVRATPPGTIFRTPTSQSYTGPITVELEVLDLQVTACHFGERISVFFSHWEIDGQVQPNGRTKVMLTLTQNTTARAVYTISRCAKLETDKKEYQSGEIVTIRLINSCQATLTLSNSAPWVIKDSQGRVVFTPTALQVITEVRSGETKSWPWDQKDNNRQQVPAGTYTVELETMDAGTYKATFEIKAIDKVKLDVKALGQIKQGPITINVGISVPVLVNGIPMITPVSLQLDKNKPVLLTAQQVVKVTLPPPFGQRTFVFQRWQCDGQTSTSTTIIFTLSTDITCTAVYVEGE